jgi:hypothetical protein
MAAGRALLWAAAVTGLMLAASRLIGIPPLSERISAHAGRELAALEAALAVGFTLAAWRPGRHAGGLLWGGGDRGRVDAAGVRRRRADRP